MKNVLVIGSGGREHALAWKLSQSKEIGRIFVAPGNGGTSQIAENIPISATDTDKLIKFVKSNNIYLTIVGPDEVLASGVVNEFQKNNLNIFGPTKKAAQIEWSKAYAKQLMKKYGIPTANYATFSDLAEAKRYVTTAAFPLVIKADGLALGKGVFICQDKKEAITALEAIANSLGESGKTVVIEEYLEGKEVSAHAICDGKNFVLFPLAQDHKRIGEGNTGLNTGGMGTICPVPEPLDEIKNIIERTLYALKKDGREFTGCLFPGLMLTSTGIKVLEFNARFGDPETQVYMRLLNTDLLEIFEATTEKRLNEIKLSWKPGAATCIVLASEGYPNTYKTGLEITGLNQTFNNEVVIFHAGTKKENDKILTSGGRVLNVTAHGENLDEALEQAYAVTNIIHFPGKQYRKDIGFQYT